MPLKRDALDDDSEADGSRSTKYCSHCYQDGKLTEPDLTADQMGEKVRGKMKEMHIPGFVAKSLTKGIPELKRWKSAAV